MINLAIINQICSQNKIIFTNVTSSVTSSYVLKDSQQVADDTELLGYTSANSFVATSFTASSDYTLTKVEALVYRVGSAAYTIKGYFLNDNGSGAPTSSAVITSSTSYLQSNLTDATAGDWYSFTFSPGISCISGAKYHFSLYMDTQETTNYARWKLKYTGATGEQTSKTQFAVLPAWELLTANSQANFKAYATE